MSEATRVWHPVSTFPSPGMLLLVKLQNGEEVQAVRPDYVRSYSSDPAYRTPEGVPLQGVTEWSIW